jgi:hypothetical protein
LKLESGDYQIIFGESKTEVCITTGITNAFKSIYEFKNEVNSKGKKKSGLAYEKSLISDHLAKETFSDEERAFIKSIVYPSRKNNFDVDDAFGIFVGYEMDVDSSDRDLPNSEFRIKIKNRIKEEVEGRFDHIMKKINEYSLSGHSFYIYFLPITNLDDNRKMIQEGITK